MQPSSHRLLLLRHAEAMPASSGAQGDAARTLSSAGHERASALAVVLDGVAIDHIWASPAVRVQQTLGPILERQNLHRPPRLVIEAPIYSTCGAGLLDLLRGTPEAAATCLLVGHNPSLDEAAEQLLSPEAFRSFYGFRPGTLLDLEIRSPWIDLDSQFVTRIHGLGQAKAGP